MNNLENLPEIVNRQLGGLEATPTLLAKIKINGAEAQVRKPMTARWKPIAASALTLMVLVGAGWAVLDEKADTTPEPGTVNIIDSHSAGGETKPTEAPLAGDLPQGSITMSSGSHSSGGTIFAEAQGSSFPLITVNGATYRMLSTPNGISSGLLGTALGNVSEYNIEPALGSGSIVSNAAAQGEAVNAIAGMDGAMIAANVNGSLRVFQRVSYAGTATIGSESLADTLCSPGDVSWIELAGVGTVQGADAQALMGILLDNADYKSTGMSGSGSLKIGLNNGLTMQLLAGDDMVSACGTWSCPDFFEAFHEAVGQ